MKKSEADNRAVFLMAEDEDGPLVSIGLSSDAWDYMKDGKTHNFDLRKVGIPLRLMIFGGGTKKEMLEQLKYEAEAAGIKVNVDEKMLRNLGFNPDPLPPGKNGGKK